MSDARKWELTGEWRASLPGEPLVFRADSAPVYLELHVGETLYARTSLHSLGLQILESVQYVVTGRPYSELGATPPPRAEWTLEDVARWVAGDGSDAQRLALADGIRQGEWRR